MKRTLVVIGTCLLCVAAYAGNGQVSEKGQRGQVAEKGQRGQVAEKANADRSLKKANADRSLKKANADRSLKKANAVKNSLAIVKYCNRRGHLLSGSFLES